MLELRFRDLAKSKVYRDAIASGRDPSEFTRKRVIIAPSLVGPGEDTSPRQLSSSQPSGGPHHGNTSGLNAACPSTEPRVKPEKADLHGYRKWMEERKVLRQNLDQCGKMHDWLRGKPSLSELEWRVHKQQLAELPEKQKRKADDKHMEYEDEHQIYGSCDSKNPPSISQPLPPILAKINDYLTKKRLRMYDLFVLADRDKDWKITRKEFLEVMKKAGIPIKDSEVEQLIVGLDQNNNDVLEYKELVQGRDLFVVNERIKKHSESDLLSLAHDSTDSSEHHLDVDPGLDGLTRQNSSQSLLSLPDIKSSSDLLPMQQDKEKWLKRQKKKEKHRHKAKGSEKQERQLCTMGGDTGMMVDRFQKQKQKEYEKILELCHLHGVKLSRNMLERALLHPEDRSLDMCVSSLKSLKNGLLSEEEVYRQLAPSSEEHKRRFSKVRRKSSVQTYYVYPPAASVTPKKERVNLSSGPANVSRRADCWMTYEEYSKLTRNLDSRFDKSWKPSDDNAYWPSYILDKVRLYLDQPRTQVRSENSIFEVIHNRTIH